MKKQINPTIKAHLIRGAFYLLLLVAVCAIPFALAQRNAKPTKAPSIQGEKAEIVWQTGTFSAAARARRLSGVHAKVASKVQARAKRASSL